MTDDGSARETDDFANRLIGVVNNAMLALVISVGVRTGLFDTMESLPPSSSAEIATAAGLDERYVREWLAAVSAGGVIVHDPANMTFVLPAAHAAAMKRLVSGPGGCRLAGLAQDVGVVARLEDKVVDCFRRGGGLPYEALWSAFGASLGAASRRAWPVEDVALLEGALPLVPQVVERLRSGIDVADVGCGAGRQLNVMAQRFPASRFVGFDFYADELLDAGRSQARLNGLTNVRFEKKDAATLDGSEMFDFITTFDAVHDQARPDLVLRGNREIAPPTRYLPLCRHFRFEHFGRQPVRPCRDVQVHLVCNALHERVIGLWRDGPRDSMGRAARVPDDHRGWFRVGRDGAPTW